MPAEVVGERLRVDGMTILKTADQVAIAICLTRGKPLLQLTCPMCAQRGEGAVGAHPGPEATAYVLYGIAGRLILELSQTTGEDREAILSRILL